MPKYKEKIIKILNKTRPRLSISNDLEFKNCFGAVACYLDGQLFIVCENFGVALKLPSKTLSTLFDSKNGKQLKYFKNGHVKKDYAIISKKILDNHIELKKLVDRSIKFTTSSEI